jgi:hypothetical protein
MKTLLLLTLLVPTLTFAQVTERTFEAMTRTENNKPLVGDVVLTDLISNDSFDGEHFKIVNGKGDDAIKFDADEALTFRAATAYYHLTKARTYFIEKIKSDYVAKLPKMVIRIEHSNQFSELGHFTHDKYDPQFNNALTIPAGEGLASKGVKPWGNEIWFRPAKRVNIKELKVNGLANQEFQVLMAGFREQIHMQSLQRFLSNTVMAMTQENAVSPFSTDNLIRTVGSSIIMELGYQFMDPITKFFSRKWYWLDTAVVPEIIYHEYSHVALSDHLVLSHSTAIIEGMADYFAGQMANSPKLAMNIKKYNTYNGKDAKRKQDYKIVGDDKGEAFMFELRKKLTTNSNIRNQLVEGILETCEAECTTPFVDKIRILKALNLKGI